jgi:glutathione S-transferase
MLTIYGRTNSVNVQKVLWCLGETGVPYERIDAGLQHGKNNEPWYLALNPNGRVPLLVDGALTLWESNSIVRYLAAKHSFGELYPADPAARGLAERWMDWQLSTLVGPVSAVFQSLVRTPPEARDSAAIERNTAAANRAMTILDAHLAKQAYVGGPAFTIGDIPAAAVAYRWLALPSVERPALPAVAAWQARLAARPPFRTVVMQPLS